MITGILIGFYAAGFCACFSCWILLALLGGGTVLELLGAAAMAAAWPVTLPWMVISTFKCVFVWKGVNRVERNI